jgi:hypothetical protein
MPNVVMIQDAARVQWATCPLEEISTKEAVEQLVGGPVESASECTARVVGRPAPPEHDSTSPVRVFRRTSGVMHPMVGAIHQAYQDHRPLVLSPDMFWLLVAQGLALHVNNHPDEFRDRFRVGPGQEEIEILNDDLRKGSSENAWENVVEDFCEQITDRIGGDNYAQIVTTFSTTGLVDRAANVIVLMDTVKSYFQYCVRTRCGIPQVVLEGTAADWERLRDKTESLGKTYAVTWWTDRLLPILDRVARNAAGKEDAALWESIYKQVDASGGPYLNGWITDFFPYVGCDEPKDRNRAFRQEPIPDNSRIFEAAFGSRITTEQLPSSLSKVPFVWKYLDEEFRMEFLAGFVGFTQEAETLRLRPKIGWAVREAG